MKRYQPLLEDRVEEVIQDSLDGILRKQGPLIPRGKRRKRVPQISIIEEAVRRKLQRERGQ